MNMMRGVVDVTRLVDEQPIGAFTIRLVILSFAVMLTDGYDLLAASLGAPSLVADWHLKPEMLGSIFSASPLGMVVGAPLLGWVGDRFGRRSTVIFGAALYGVMSLACAWSQSVEQMMVLRFITGIGLGGMLPNITALNAEFAPRRARATLVVLMFLGVTVGSTAPGLVLASFSGISWQTLYIVGGVAPLVLVVALLIWLPESIKFLALRDDKKSRAKLVRIVHKLRPDLAVSSDTVFTGVDSKRATSVPVAELFQDGLHWITPLLWLLFVANLTANYFLYSWLPILFHSNGFTQGQAAMTINCYYLGGVIGGLIVSRLMDKRGLAAIAIFSAVGFFAIASIGLPNLPVYATIGFVFLSGFCVIGVQMGLNAAGGLIYPTRIRAAGAGWAFGVGRLGGIFGPKLGGVLIAMHLPLVQLFIAPAVPLAIAAVACFVLMQLCRKRFNGDQLDDAAAVRS